MSWTVYPETRRRVTQKRLACAATSCTPLAFTFAGFMSWLRYSGNFHLQRQDRRVLVLHGRCGGPALLHTPASLIALLPCLPSCSVLRPGPHTPVGPAAPVHRKQALQHLLQVLGPAAMSS